MWKDPIVEEIRRVRAEHVASFNYDLELIYQDLKEAEIRSGERTVSLPPKRLPPPAACAPVEAGSSSGR